MPESNVLERVVEAHRAVRIFVARVGELEEPTAIMPHVERLSELLPGHFTMEEEEGFIERVRRLHDNGEAHAEQLLEEHRMFLVELAELLLDGHISGDGRWVQRVRQFAERLAEHERLEAQLGLETRRSAIDVGDNAHG